MRAKRLLKQFNWRFLLVRILVNAIALAVTAAVVPKIYFVDKSIWSWLLMAALLGILNALLKPVLQILTLQFIFVTFGLVVVLVNALILGLLSFIFPSRFAVDNLLWALVGGLVLGLLSSFLESLLGLTMPIVPEEEAALRRQLEEEERHIHPLAAARRESAPEEQALIIEPPAHDAAAEAVAPGPEEGSSPPEVVEAEPFDSGVAPPAEAGSVVDPEPAPETGEEQEEDGS